MAGINAGEAAMAGFEVIKRNPLAPAVWGLITIGLSILPLLMIGPAYLAFFRDMFASGGEPDVEALSQISTMSPAYTLVSYATSFLSLALIGGAVMRAVIFPDDKAWLYMRVTMREVLMVAVYVVTVILLTIGIVVVVIPFAIMLGIASTGGEGAMAGIAIIGGLALLVAIVYFALRFSMAMPMTFAKKNFLLFESWQMTKGHTGSLFLVGLLSFIFVMLIQLVVTAVMLAAVVAVLFGGHIDFEAIGNNPQAFFTEERMMSLVPALIGALLIGGVIQGYLSTIMYAPWAKAYLMLAGRPEDVFDDAPEPATA